MVHHFDGGSLVVVEALIEGVFRQQWNLLAEFSKCRLSLPMWLDDLTVVAKAAHGEVGSK